MKTTKSLVAVVLTLAGCSSDSGSPAPEGPKGTLFGNALVELFPPPDGYATFTAQFFDAPPPAVHNVETKQESSGCKLLTPVLCEPACAVGSYCTPTKECKPKPSPVGVGMLKVEGLSGMTLMLEPTPPLMNYSGPTLQPFPPCNEGSSVSVQSDKFTTSIKCIAPLMLTSALPIPVKSGQATKITWTPPGTAGISRIFIALEIAHHGGYRGQVDCDVADTGSFDIPAPLVTALRDLGLAGYPSVAVTRYSTNSPASDPEAKLTMPSRVEVPVDTGVISCGSGESPPCAAGTTCSQELKLCQ